MEKVLISMWEFEEFNNQISDFMVGIILYFKDIHLSVLKINKMYV